MTIKEKLEQEWEQYGEDAAPSWDYVANIMDEHLTEQLHTALGECTQREFFNAYIEMEPHFAEITNW